MGRGWFIPGQIRALDGGPNCCMSNSRSGRVPCRYFCNSHFITVQFRISNLRNGQCHFTNIFPMSIGLMSHVNFRKWRCGPVGFKGEETSNFPFSCA